MEVYTPKEHNLSQMNPIDKALYKLEVKLKAAFPRLFAHEETMVIWNGKGYAYDPALFGEQSNYRDFETFTNAEGKDVLIPTVSRAAQDIAMNRTPRKTPYEK